MVNDKLLSQLRLRVAHYQKAKQHADNLALKHGITPAGEISREQSKLFEEFITELEKIIENGEKENNKTREYAEQNQQAGNVHL